MSKISELGFPALYRSLVAQPGQMQLFSPRAQPAAKPTPRADYYLYECEDSCLPTARSLNFYSTLSTPPTSVR